ncbi:hypothetical protein AB0M61_01550 [Streptomyces sp. NPDC051642]|uniref:hypothetical protein n=1 Tax=Streptomyces sp. NPDC051642 TaxID=3154646 RepID=UPI003420352F
MPTVRTTFQPDKEIEVGDVEYAQLKTQGLLVDEPASDSAPPATAATATPVRKTSTGAAGSKES